MITFFGTKRSVQRLDLDFLRPGQRVGKLRFQGIAFALSAALLIVVTSHLINVIKQTDTKRASIELNIKHRGSLATQARTRTQPIEGTAAIVTELKAIQDRLNYPWQTLLAFLEMQQQDDIALLVLDPDRQSGITKVTAEAKNISSMMTYLDSMQKSDAFAGVFLASHEVETKRAGSPVRFELKALWKGESGVAKMLKPITSLASTEPESNDISSTTLSRNKQSIFQLAPVQQATVMADKAK